MLYDAELQAFPVSEVKSGDDTDMNVTIAAEPEEHCPSDISRLRVSVAASNGQSFCILLNDRITAR